MVSTAPPNSSSGRAAGKVWGRRKRVASSNKRSTSVSAPRARAVSTLPAITPNAWWLMYFTSAARGLTRGLATPDRAGARPCSSPTLGALLDVDARMIVPSRYSTPPARDGTASRVRRASSLEVWSLISAAVGMSMAVYDAGMEGGGLGDLFGDPEELQRRLAEFAEQMQGQQRLVWADNAIKLAVDLTVAAIARVNVQGNAEAQAEEIRTVMARVFPEAVALVREAREGLQ